jgi:stage V sporulation protein B
MKNRFFANTVLLTLTTQVLRVCGIVLVAFLSGRIGTEGVGLFQLILSVYALISTVVTSGPGMAVTRITAEDLGKSGHTRTSNVLKICVIYSLILSVLVGGALFLFADFIGRGILSDARTVLSLRAIAPSLPFIALTSCLRSYFFGMKKVMMPVSVMLFEQVVQIAVIIAILGAYAPQGLEQACFAIFMSFTVAEVISFVFGYLLYRIGKNPRPEIVRDAQLHRKVLGIALPVAGSAYLRSGLRTAENILIPAGIRVFVGSEAAALSQYGLLMGMVMPVMLFPSAFLYAMATLVVPEISEAAAVNDRKKIKHTISRGMEFTLLFSLLFSGIYICFAKDLGLAVYQSAQAGTLIRTLAPLVPLMYLDFLVDGMLNGLNQQMKTLGINILDYSLRITLILVLVPRYGLAAYIAIFFLSTVLNAYLSIRTLLRTANVRINLSQWVFKPALAVFLAGALVTLGYRLLPVEQFSGLSAALKITLTSIFYLLFLFAFGCLKKQDMLWLKNTIKRDRAGNKQRARIKQVRA